MRKRVSIMDLRIWRLQRSQFSSQYFFSINALTICGLRDNVHVEINKINKNKGAQILNKINAGMHSW